MRSSRFLLLVVAALAMGAANMPVPSDAADEPPAAQVADPSPAIPAVVAPVEPLAPAPAVAVVQVAADPLAALDVGQLAVLVKSPYGILAVAAGLVHLLMEVLKGLWLAVAAWPAARKRAVALLLGAAVGGLLSLAGPVAWWIGLVAGTLGAVVPVAGRALRKGLRTSGGGSRGLAAVLLTAGLLAAGVAFPSNASAMPGCSAAQVQAWKGAGIVGAQCYAECGIGKTTGYVQDWKGGKSINGEDIGWDALSCLWPCLAKAGWTLVPGLVLASAEDAKASSSVSSGLVEADQAGKLVPKIDKSPAFCKVKPETLDNSKRALLEACGCGEVPRCSVVVRSE